MDSQPPTPQLKGKVLKNTIVKKVNKLIFHNGMRFKKPAKSFWPYTLVIELSMTREI